LNPFVSLSIKGHQFFTLKTYRAASPVPGWGQLAPGPWQAWPCVSPGAANSWISFKQKLRNISILWQKIQG
jgi:hypothetical protein